MSKQKIVITFFITLFIVYSVSVIMFLSRFNNPREFFLYLVNSLPTRIYEVSIDSRNLHIIRKPVVTLPVTQIGELRKLLETRQFEALNEKLNEYQKSFEIDLKNEHVVLNAFRSYEATVSSFEPNLNGWVKSSPTNYQPYLCRAFYYYAKGWQSRGHDWAYKTTEEQFMGMHLYFSKAERDLKKCLEINDKLLPAYYLLIGIYNANGTDEDEDRVIKRAIDLFPNSFLIRYAAIRAKRPRWGGSYAEMELIAKEAEQYSLLNPELSQLYGFIYTDQADIFERKKNFEKAVELYTKAINFGDNWQFYNERAQVYVFNLENYEAALNDVNRSIFICPTAFESFLLRSKIYFYKGEYKKSLEDLYTSQSIQPNDQYVQSWKERASNRMMNEGHKCYRNGKMKDAINMYGLSLQFYNGNAKTYYWRGMANYKMKNYEIALNDFLYAIDKDPRYFEAYRMIDYIKSRSREWTSIISYWNRFLSLEPNHADALLERAGTYYHLGDYQNSVRDLKNACDLGNKEACARYQEMKNIFKQP